MAETENAKREAIISELSEYEYDDESCHEKKMRQSKNCILEDEIEQLELEDRPIERKKKSSLKYSFRQRFRY